MKAVRLSTPQMPSILLAVSLAILVAPNDCRGDLVFGGDALQVYLSSVAVETGGCSKICGPETPCYGSYGVTGSSVSLTISPPGGAGCTYCGCCREGAVFATGILRAILYVDPVTGLPKSRLLGGMPARTGIPAGSRIRFLPGNARADNCLQYGATAANSAVSILAAGGSVALDHNDRSICGGYDDFEYANLAGNGLTFISYNYLYGSNCSGASTLINVAGASVYVPAANVWPDGITKTDKSALLSISITNAEDHLWENLHVVAFNDVDVAVDSLVIDQFPGDSELRWVTSSVDILGAVRVTAQSNGRSVYGTVAEEQLLYTSPQISPAILVAELGAKSASVVRRCDGLWDRCRVGRVGANLSPTEDEGVYIVPVGIPLRSRSDDFDLAEVGDQWSVEVPCGGASRVSTTDRSGFLRIVASQAGDGAHYDPSINYCGPRVVQSVSGNWTFETRLEFDPNDATMSAGIMFNGRRLVERYRVVAGEGITCFGQSVTYTEPVTYFRISKSGDQVSAFWSADGEIWTLGGTATLDVSCIALGAYRVDRGNDSSENAVADFDYVRFSNVSSVPVAGPPRHFVQLEQNYPNPFNPRTEIAFTLENEAPVSIRVYDLAGRLVSVVLDGKIFEKGRNIADWNAKDMNGIELPAGVYFYRLEVGEYSETKRMALIK